MSKTFKLFGVIAISNAQRPKFSVIKYRYASALWTLTETLHGVLIIAAELAKERTKVKKKSREKHFLRI